MNPQPIFQMVSRSRLLQVYLRNVSISRRHLCLISLTQLSSQTTSTTNHTPNIPLNHQEMTMQRFSSYVKHPTEFPSKKSNRDSTGHNFSNEHIFSPNRLHDNNRAIFVGGLSKFTTVKSLYEYFLRFGAITGCRLAREKPTGISKDYGFVEFETVEQAKKASEFFPHNIDDQEVNINNVFNSSPHYIDNKTVDVKQASVRQREFTLIVRKLSPNTTNESLREFYSRFGELTQCDVKFDCQTGQSRGFGYVSFSSQKELNTAINAEPHIIDGVKVKLNYATNEFDVIVTNLTPNITEEALNDCFSRYGELRNCEIKESLPGVRTGFVGFWSEEEVLRALADRPHIIEGKMVSTQQKDQQFSVYIGNLPFDATDDSLFQTFSNFGKIVHWEVKRDHNTNRSRGIGYVSFEKAEQAVQAVNGGPHFMNGRTLKVEPSKIAFLSKKFIK